MEDIRGVSGGFNKNLKRPSYKKYLIFILVILILLLLFLVIFGSDLFSSSNKSTVKIEENNSYCGDGTLSYYCSPTQPYFCQAGKLIDLASVCGCPDGFVKKGDSCSSPYQTNPSVIDLKYTLRGETNSINFTVYGGFEDYISKVPRSIFYSPGVNSSRGDFIIKAINEEEQRKFLMPLVIEIQNLTNNKDDQMRIAISIVQNIPFGPSNKTYFFGDTKVNYSRYPYDVLYDMQGICGEKTDLLAFLLKEMGYSVSAFYYEAENHEVLGIKCPIEESLMNTGYCFVETTAPSIITDNKLSYAGVGKLISIPVMYLISQGNSIGSNLNEYSDAKKLIRIRDSMEKTGLIWPFQKKALDSLKIKYGLAEQYYG